MSVLPASGEPPLASRALLASAAAALCDSDPEVRSGDCWGTGAPFWAAGVAARELRVEASRPAADSFFGRGLLLLSLWPVWPGGSVRLPGSQLTALLWALSGVIRRRVAARLPRRSLAALSGTPLQACKRLALPALP